VYDRNLEAARHYAAEMSREIGVGVEVAANPSQLVEKSDLVVTSTASRAPMLMLESLRQGLHITAMGADGPGKQELDPKILGRADLMVCDRKSQCMRLGELQHALREGILTEQSEIIELGEITSGSKPGRSSENQITVCDLTGVGVQDTAIAVLAYNLAIEASMGTKFDPSSVYVESSSS